MLAFVLTGWRFAGNDKDKEELLMRLVMQCLSHSHYTDLDVNDSFSEKIYELYLDRLDYNHRFFLREDVDKLEKYRDKIDDQIRTGRDDFFDLSVDLYEKRIKEAKNYYEDLLSRPFDFDVDEEIETDAEKLPYAANKDELKERWRKSLKYQVMTRVLSEMDSQEKALEKAKEKEEAGEEVEEMPEQKDFATLEAEAREKVLKSHEDWFKRLSRLDEEDMFSSYMNAVVNVFDPHTTYFPPADKENFDIKMSGKLEGIGATLEEREGYIRVVRIVPGSACWKQGDLKEGFSILKVAQGEDEPVDVIDMPLDEAVQLIRGPKGTEVRLTVKDLEGETFIIPIVRDVVVLDETFAKSSILEKDDMKIGFIHLPKFYADFNDRGGRFCSVDVAAEIAKLKSENVDGIVLDLRNNGGGSLQDVVNMTGLFIEEGPIVQIKGRDNAPMVMKDRDSRVQYDGPLVLLVNQYSASASEIMAAAIQDYRRGVIVGTPTFGKGTVQRFFDLDRLIGPDQANLAPLGSIKLTTQKFYRVNGGATQLKGVTPDIVLPGTYTYIPVGEQEQEYPMEWDEIRPANYQLWHYSSDDMEVLKQKSRERVSNSQIFDMIDENARRLKRLRDDSTDPLNFAAYKAERKQRQEESERYKDMATKIEGLTIRPTEADAPGMEEDESKKARFEEWQKSLEKDSYLEEALHVIGDLQQIDRLAEHDEK